MYARGPRRALRSKGWVPASVVVLLVLLVVDPGPTVAGGASARDAPARGHPPTSSKALHRPSSVGWTGSWPPPDGRPRPAVGLSPSSFEVSDAPPLGTEADGLGLAVDPLTQDAFLTNTAVGTVQEVNLTSGVILRTISTVTAFPWGVPLFEALDPTDHELFIGWTNFTTSPQQGGVLVLRESDLSRVAAVVFPGVTGDGFVPTQLAWDPTTDQVFTENISRSANLSFAIAAIDARTYSVVAYLFIAPSFCSPFASCGRFGLACAEGILVVSAGSRSVPVFTTRNDTLLSVLPGLPRSTAVLPTYDGGSNVFLVNESGNTFIDLNLTTFQLRDLPIVLPTRTTGNASALAYDPAHRALLFADGATAGNLTSYPVNGSRVVGHFMDASLPGVPGAYAFTGLVVDPPVHAVVAVGGPPQGVATFGLPTLASPRFYSSAPLGENAVAIDPAAGLYFVAGLFPNVTAGIGISDNHVLWENGAGGNPLAGVVAAPARHELFEEGAVSGTIVGLSELTGAVEQTIDLGPATVVALLAIDPEHQWLYLISVNPSRVLLYNFSSGLLVGSVPLPGMRGCAIAVDPQGLRAFVSNCATPGNVTEVDGSTLQRSAVFPVSGRPASLAWDGQGDLYVGNLLGRNITVLHLGNASPPTMIVTPPGLVLGGMSVDLVDGVLFVAATGPPGNPSVRMIGTGAGSPSLGPLNVTSVCGQLEWDPGTSTLFGCGDGPISGYWAHLRGVVSPPLNFGLTPRNDSLDLNWSTPLFAGSGPLNYSVGVASSPQGPFSATAFGNMTQGTVGGLTDGVPYFATVQASDPTNQSPRVPPLQGVPVGVPYPPQSNHAVLEPNGTIEVTWAAPASDDGSPVTGYEVQLRMGGTLVGDVNTTGALSVSLGSPGSGAAYTIVVVAWNAVGSSHPSSPANVQIGSSTVALETLGLLGVAVAGAAAIAGVVLVRRRGRGGMPGGAETQEVEPPSDGGYPAFEPPTQIPPRGGSSELETPTYPPPTDSYDSGP
ncbi:MAG: fibronectin type III domain-containing protein [Thermoplasmata archaeon]|nr:fibronectin type III domain-containing protein [Thermoplasmata archaeon]